MDPAPNVSLSERPRINMNEEAEVIYWTGQFKVTKERLKEAVKSAGNSVKAVHAYFKR